MTPWALHERKAQGVERIFGRGSRRSVRHPYHELKSSLQAWMKFTESLNEVTLQLRHKNINTG